MASTIPENIFKSYDIRGLYPEEINEENIYQITQGVCRYIKETVGDIKVTLVTGRDMRFSGPTLYPIFQKAILDAGVDIIDIDLAATTTFYFAVRYFNATAGIQLSASHNPPNYSGLKMVINTPQGLIKIGKSTGMDKVRQYALEGHVLKANTTGHIEKKKDVVKAEVENALHIINGTAIKPLKIVADPANAMGSTYIDALFRYIPGDLVRMNFELDGSFPAHQPDPLIKANVKELQNRVLEEKADLGLAPDGDGDRLFFVDEKGQIVPASIITALICKEVLKKHPGATILYDIRYTFTPKEIISNLGGKSDITPVGHSFITEKMHRTGAVFGGESSGHYFFKETGNGESQVPVIIAVLKEMSETGKPLSQIAAETAKSHESGEHNFRTDKAQEILNKLKEKYSGGQLITIDGIAIEYPTWRFGVRISNTEPLMRLNLESKSEPEMKSKLEEIMNFIKSQGAEVVGEH